MKLSNEKQRLVITGAMLCWCVALLLVRIEATANWMGVGLLWNLFLATIPLFWGAAFQWTLQRGRPVFAALSFGLWLLFLPNAPYILTDLMHFGLRPPLPPWFVLAMLLSCAGTGTMLGYLSLSIVHVTIENRFGRMWGWIVATISLMLCGFGIYLGRFLRWNSWDVVTRPLALFRNIAAQFADSGPYPNSLHVTLIFGGGLLLGYLALCVIAVSMAGQTPESVH